MMLVTVGTVVRKNSVFVFEMAAELKKFESCVVCEVSGYQKFGSHHAPLNKTAFMALLIIILRTQQFVTSNLPVSSGA